MQHRCPGSAGLLRIENSGKDVVLDLHEPDCRVSCGGGLGDDRGDALADEADGVIEHPRVVGVVGAVFVAARGEACGRGILVREHGDNPRDSAGGIRVDRDDAGMRVRRADNAQHQGSGDGLVERVRLATLHDTARGLGNHRRPNAAGRDRGRTGLAHRAHDRRRDCFANRAVAGAAAQAPLHAAVEFGQVGFGEGGCRDRHPWRAEPALEPEVFDELLLHGVQFVARCEAPRGRDDGAIHALGGHDARVDGLAIDDHGACAAVARVAPLLDLGVSMLAKECAQALSRGGVALEVCAVDGESHAASSIARSATTRSASSAVTARRQSASPSASVKKSVGLVTSARNCARLGSPGYRKT